MSPTQKTIQDLLTTAKSFSGDGFEKHHSYPFLLGREVLEEEFSFATAISHADEPQLAAQHQGLRIRDWVLPVNKPGATKQQRVFVGRSSNNDLAVPHPTVSKLHAYFTYESEKWWIVDVGSSNGTTVNGMKAPPRAKTALYDKDVVVFGRCAFSFLTARSLFLLLSRMAQAIDERDIP